MHESYSINQISEALATASRTPYFTGYQYIAAANELAAERGENPDDLGFAPASELAFIGGNCIYMIDLLAQNLPEGLDYRPIAGKLSGNDQSIDHFALLAGNDRYFLDPFLGAAEPVVLGEVMNSPDPIITSSIIEQRYLQSEITLSPDGQKSFTVALFSVLGEQLEKKLLGHNYEIQAAGIAHSDYPTHLDIVHLTKVPVFSIILPDPESQHVLTYVWSRRRKEFHKIGMIDYPNNDMYRVPGGEFPHYIERLEGLLGLSIAEINNAMVNTHEAAKYLQSHGVV